MTRKRSLHYAGAGKMACEIPLSLALLVAVMSVQGCQTAVLPDVEEERPPVVDDSVMKIESFGFEKKFNPALQDDVSTTIAGTVVSDGEGIAYYADPRSLVATFGLYAADDVEEVTLSVSAEGEDEFRILASGASEADYMRPVVLRLSGMRDGTRLSRDYKFRFHNLNTGLPVLYLFTPGGSSITSKDIWTGQCRVYLDAAGKKDASGELYTEDYYGVNDNLKGRGNTTWGQSKKPYAVKLDKRASLLGLPEHKRWVLLANAMDKSMMRNRLAYEIASRCDALEWTPRSRFVEVVMNGEHIGLYLFAEQIRADENRVPVPDGNDALDPAKGGSLSADPSSLGYLIEADRYWGDMQYETSALWWRTGRYSGSGSTTWPNGDMVSWASGCSYRTNYGDGSKFSFGLKNPDDEALITSSSVHFSYIRDFVLDVEKEVLGSSHGLSRIDVDSFIDYWLVYELTLNQEPNNPGSCYMYKKPDSAGGRLYAGPVWDFDFGTFDPDLTDSGLYYDKRNKFLCLNSLWYVGLFENSSFRQAVKTRWSMLKPKLELDGFVDDNRKYILKSVTLNHQIYGDSWGGSDPNGEYWMSMEQAIDKIYGNLLQRIEDLDRLISAMP